jgi:hypothetical protein
MAFVVHRFSITFWFHSGDREPLVADGVPFKQLPAQAAFWSENGLIVPRQFRAILDQIGSLAVARKRRGMQGRTASTIISSEDGGWACEIKRTS